ncbi:RNA-binding protein 7 [Hyperolius riggenbachi]|uniref:RNA-binding protein 7 n=1 Tax=Hyperolius riggenbachi TaxID=752182 RepID=UPI0035A2CF10
MGSGQADRTLFVGNLHPKATEELLFELFLQAGPALNVKIPKDKDGKPKLFAFVNFKHEESVRYGMNLLNGIKLYGRPLKLQFRSGSSHVSQDANSTSHSSQENNLGAGNRATPSDNRHDGNGDPVKYEQSHGVPSYQRSYSTPDNLHRQVMMNNYYQQESPHGARTHSPDSPSSSSYPTNSNWYNSSSTPSQRPYDATPSHRNERNHGSHPYKNEAYHNRDMYHRASQEDYHYRSRGHEKPSSDPRNDPRWYPNRR